MDTLPIDEEVDGDIIDVHWSDGLLYFELDESWVCVDLSGNRLGERKPPKVEQKDTARQRDWLFDPDQFTVLLNGSLLPFQVDGVHEVEARLWCWNEGGMLVVLDLDDFQSADR